MTRGDRVTSVDATDADGYKDHVAALAGCGARFLVRRGARQGPEGAFGSRGVVIEFPSCEAALDCCHSPEYAAAMSVRVGRQTMTLAIPDGYGGAQPGQD